MSKIKVGDRIRRLAPGRDWCPTGYEVVVYESVGQDLRYIAIDGSERVVVFQAEWEVVKPEVDWASIPPGTRLHCVRNFEGRLTEGKIYEFLSYAASPAGSGIQIKACDKGHTCWWGSIYPRSDGSRYFEPILERATSEELMKQLVEADQEANDAFVTWSVTQDNADAIREALSEALLLESSGQY